MINIGVAGYGTDQEMLLLKRLYHRLQPDMVFLIFTGTNDFDDNSTNFSYGFFKPYFRASGDTLQLAGVPVPRSIRSRIGTVPLLFDVSYFARFIGMLVAMISERQKIVVPDPSKKLVLLLKSFVELHSAKFLLGFENTTDRFAKELSESGVFTVDLITKLRYTTHATHWTPEGHIWVKNKICQTFSSAAFRKQYGEDAPVCKEQ